MAFKVVDKDEKIITLVAAIIDESGSMSGVRDETITGYNSFVSRIQTEQEGKEAYVSTFTFDSEGTIGGAPVKPMVRAIQDTVVLANATPLSKDNYNPSGLTPLYDAIGTAVRSIDKAVAEKKINRVTLLIQTDGAENSSREFTHAAVTQLIKDRTDAGWQIIFLGADLHNATEIGRSIGINAMNTMRYSKGMTGQTFAATAAGTSAYRSSLNASSINTLSESEKQSLAGGLSSGAVPDPKSSSSSN